MQHAKDQLDTKHVVDSKTRRQFLAFWLKFNPKTRQLTLAKIFNVCTR